MKMTRNQVSGVAEVCLSIWSTWTGCTFPVWHWDNKLCSDGSVWLNKFWKLWWMLKSADLSLNINLWSISCATSIFVSFHFSSNWSDFGIITSKCWSFFAGSIFGRTYCFQADNAPRNLVNLLNNSYTGKPTEEIDGLVCSHCSLEASLRWSLNLGKCHVRLLPCGTSQFVFFLPWNFSPMFFFFSRKIDDDDDDDDDDVFSHHLGIRRIKVEPCWNPAARFLRSERAIALPASLKPSALPTVLPNTSMLRDWKHYDQPQLLQQCLGQGGMSLVIEVCSCTSFLPQTGANLGLYEIYIDI